MFIQESALPHTEDRSRHIPAALVLCIDHAHNTNKLPSSRTGGTA